jgi:hypothetical protein
MHRAVVPASFPATVLLLRVNALVLVIPWMLVWALALVVMPFFWAVGLGARATARRRDGELLLHWHLIVLVLVAMRGMTISVRTKEHRVYLKWI